MLFVVLVWGLFIPCKGHKYAGNMVLVQWISKQIHTHTEKQKRDNGEFYLVILHCKFLEFDFDCKMK